MYGDDRRRFCSQCKLNVYNLSGMTRDEAEQLVMNSEGRLCVRFFRRKDGTVLTQDCPAGNFAEQVDRCGRHVLIGARLVLARDLGDHRDDGRGRGAATPGRPWYA